LGVEKKLKIIIRARAASVPVTKEPVGLARQDGKRPDGLTLIPWQRGKPLTWDVTAAHTLADSYVNVTACSGGAAAEQAAGRKTAKYDLLVQTGHLFQPIAEEMLGPSNKSSRAYRFLFGAGPQDSVYFRRQPRAQLSLPAHIYHNSAL